MNSSDPFARFNNAVDALLGQVSNPVAFAALPLSIPQTKTKERRAPGRSLPSPEEPESPNDDMFTSFCFVQPANGANRSDSPAFLPRGHSDRSCSITPQDATQSTKTVEELLLENAELKSNLDQLAVQFQKMVNVQNKDRETLKHSILDLRRDIQRTSARRDVSMSLMSLPTAAAQAHPPLPLNNARALELEKELDALKQEVLTFREISMGCRVLEGAKNVHLLKQLHVTRLNAAKYKSRYDQLRDAIKKKKAGKEIGNQEASPSETVGSKPSQPANQAHPKEEQQAASDTAVG